MDYRADIETLLQRLRPHSLLCLGRECDNLLQAYLQSEPDCTVVTLTPGEWSRIDALGQFDLALLCEEFEDLDKVEAAHLLARLRDLHGGRFVLVHKQSQTSESDWHDDELLALGLRLLKQHTVGTVHYVLYYFDLYDYKTTPDWLSPRFWANPERWDKDYW